MTFGWLESILFGLFSGIVEILPVSGRAHNALLLKILGADRFHSLLFLMIRLAVMAAIYVSFQKQIVKVMRAINLASIPKKRRKRPLDVKSLKDFALWRRMSLPVVILFLFYGKFSQLDYSQLWIAILMFLNGIILYLPRFFATGNKDSRTITRLEGFLMGLGGSMAVLPGISGTAASLSVASVCGVERKYALTMVLLMNFVVNLCFAVYDVIVLIGGGIGTLGLILILKFLAAAVAAFVGTLLGIRLMKFLAEGAGYTGFAFYSWGLALFIFILNLIA